VGYALLIPLISTALWRNFAIQTKDRVENLSRVNQNLAKVRSAIAEGNSLDDIQRRIASLQAPDLPLESTSILKPLPFIKQSLFAKVDLAQRQLERRLGPKSPIEIWIEIQASLATLLAAVLLAIGFAAAAERRGSYRSLLMELQQIISDKFKRKHYSHR
jgi:hypothetical protein